MAELVWEGKYRDGKRVAPVRIALPFQTVETVNESAQVRATRAPLLAWISGALSSFNTLLDENR